MLAHVLGSGAARISIVDGDSSASTGRKAAVSRSSPPSAAT